MLDYIVKTLCDVKYMPDLRKNLISLGTLDGNGFNYNYVNGVLKVINGVLKVIKEVMIVMKGQKLVENTYKLMGTTIVGGATTVDSESDNAILWHMLLRLWENVG